MTGAQNEAAIGAGLMDGDIATGKVRGRGGDAELGGSQADNPITLAGRLRLERGRTGIIEPPRDFRTG